MAGTIPQNLSRQDYLSLAKLAQQSNRPEHTVHYMTNLILHSPTTTLTLDEHNLLLSAYNHVTASLLSSWRHISSLQQLELVKDYKGKVEAELCDVCATLVKLLEVHLVPAAISSERKVFYLRIKGDYCRYLVDVKIGEERTQAVQQTMTTFNTAQDIAVADLAPTHPTRLMLALSFSRFYYDILNSSDKACNLAKQALEEAVAELDTLGEESYAESTHIMQLLRDNLTFWTSDLQKYQKERGDEDAQTSERMWSYCDDEALMKFLSTHEAHMLSNTRNNTDPRGGSIRKRDDLWDKVVYSYAMAQQSAPHLISQRNKDSLQCRWRMISKNVMQWVGCMKEATTMQGGLNDEDVIRKADIIYWKTYSCKFLFIEQWKMIKKYPNWEAIIQANGTPASPANKPSVETASCRKRFRTENDDEEEDEEEDEDENDDNSSDNDNDVERSTSSAEGTASSQEIDSDDSSCCAEGVNKRRIKRKLLLDYSALEDVIVQLQETIDAHKLEATSIAKMKSTMAAQKPKSKLAMAAEKLKMKLTRAAEKLEFQKKMKRMEVFQTFAVRGEVNLSQYEKELYHLLGKELYGI